jgi:hypothetical protein
MERLRHVAQGPARGDGDRSNAGPCAQAGGDLQDLEGVGGQGAEPPREQLDDVVGHLVPRQRGVVPRPPAGALHQRSILLQERDQPGEEEGVARRPRDEQLGPVRASRLRSTEAVPQPAGDGVDAQRLQDEGRHAPALVGDRPDGLVKPVLGPHLVVPIGADDEQAAMAGVGEQDREEIERRVVSPLEVVQEHHQRMLRSGEDGDEATEHETEAVQGGPGPKGAGGLLRADQDLQLGQDVDEDLPVRADRIQRGRAPRRDRRGVLREDPPHQAAEGLHQRAVRDAAPELVELALDEAPLRAEEGSADLVDEVGLADPGGPRDQQELAPPDAARSTAASIAASCVSRP